MEVNKEETKKEEAKTPVAENGKSAIAQPVLDPKAPPLYKFQPQAYAELGAYLLTRPMREVRGLYTAFYRHGKTDPYYNSDAITRLLEYLLDCPMGSAEPIINMLHAGGLIEYRVTDTPPAKPGEESGKELKENTDGQESKTLIPVPESTEA